MLASAKRILGSLALVLVLGLGLAACGDTWQGLKEDTAENTAATGQVIENAGEKVQDAAQ